MDQNTVEEGAHGVLNMSVPIQVIPIQVILAVLRPVTLALTSCHSYAVCLQDIHTSIEVPPLFATSGGVARQRD